MFNFARLATCQIGSAVLPIQVLLNRFSDVVNLIAVTSARGVARRPTPLPI